jgi:hypothetical protein
MDVFDSCQSINNFLSQNDTASARNELIGLLGFHEESGIEYSPIVNHLIRETGLYPYIKPETALWQDRFVYNVFKVDVGKKEPVTLHREQSELLKKLVQGFDIAVSAPTSFGKSFVIDAFISINKPKNVVIIVPTIALTDETRRRLYPKFSGKYKIITTSDVDLADNNIFIFPQERAINYVNKLDEIDILIIDEFYKASSDFDKERSPSLIKALMELSKVAKQRYFLAPNISTLSENPFTEGMEFVSLEFNTVLLNKHELYKQIGRDLEKKSRIFIEILQKYRTKTLIYAGTYPDIDRISTLILEHEPLSEKRLLAQFSDWLRHNYDENWSLVNLIKRGTGVHNGNLHRSLSQIQIKLFEEPDGLDRIVSTSSIIEGVNTSAENVIVWRNKNGRYKINDFTYKNIIGRSGRMFKHFIGNAFILEQPPQTEATQLSLNFPDELVGDIDEIKFEQELTREQIIKIIAFKEEMSDLLGKDVFNKFQRENTFKGANSAVVKDIASSIVEEQYAWRGLGYLNSENSEEWEHFLFKIINLEPGGWETTFTNIVNFVKILSNNWVLTIPELLEYLCDYDIGIDLFFKLERKVTFKLSSLLHNVNEIQKVVLSNEHIDIAPFIYKVSYAFLPRVVYHLEEYGLPRMISKKIHNAGLINFWEDNLQIHEAIERFHNLSRNSLTATVKDLEPFDEYIIKYFYEGIRLEE